VAVLILNKLINEVYGKSVLASRASCEKDCCQYKCY